MVDRTNPHQLTVRLLAGYATVGEPVFEEVPVEATSAPSTYRILASPGLLDGLAAGDTFVRHADGTYRVEERSGNLCVQLHYPDLDLGVRVDAELLPAVHRLGGWLDGRTEGATVFTFPLRTGFQPIEQLLDAWIVSAPGAGWSFANVYGEDGSTPLGWWDEAPFI